MTFERDQKTVHEYLCTDRGSGNQEKKNSMAGQMSLFDMVSDDQKEEFEIPLPDVGEYAKETMLAFEKEVLGVYVSGHPLGGV